MPETAFGGRLTVWGRGLSQLKIATADLFPFRMQYLPDGLGIQSSTEQESSY
jgi:hypothetical protein